MARQSGTVVANSFLKGLITEATPLAFPDNCCTDSDNVAFHITGEVEKRAGLDIEASAQYVTTGIAANEAVTEFVWRAVHGQGSVSFLVQQKGRYLYFYDVSNATGVSNNIFPASTLKVDLNSYIPSGSTTLLPEQYPCGYAVGNGDLIVVNRACNPFYIVYDPAVGAASTSITSYSLLNRDFRGLNDGLAIDFRPTASVSGIQSSNPQHYYNLLNQGWGDGVALTAWDSGLTSLPSNSDYQSLFRSASTNAFDSTLVTNFTGYNTPAPKGHYILDAFQPDRTLGGTLTYGTTVSLSTLISPTGLTRIGSLQSAFLYDGLTAASSVGACAQISGTTAWFGNDLGTATAISKVIIYGSNNEGYDQANGNFGPSGGLWPVVATLYGKSSNPASATDGTVLGTISFTNTSDESGGREIFSSDNVTTYRYVWVNLSWTQLGGITPITLVTELQTFQYSTTTTASTEDIQTFERPTTVEFYAGRAFYAGVSAINLSANVYFSQIVELRAQLANCYQANDPTSESLPDLLDSDGGVIKIPDAGQIIRLLEFQGSLLVLATNGVWIIQGSAGSPFLATNYEVRRISATGTNSPLSVASFKGQPLWWGSEGIFNVEYNPNFNSFAVNNISVGTIQTLVDAVAPINKKFIKGICDTENSIVYWLYNDTASLASTAFYTYPKILAINMLTSAFYKYSFASSPVIRGISWIQDNATSSNQSELKLTTTYPVAYHVASKDLMTYSDFESGLYYDWTNYSNHIEGVITYSSESHIGNSTSNGSAFFDGTSSKAATACTTKTSATSMYLGTNLATPKIITRAQIWGSSDQGFVNGANPSITATLYGKSSSPASGTDGTVLGSVTFTDLTGDITRHEIVSTDQVTTYAYVWVNVVQNGSVASMYVSQIEFGTFTTDVTQIYGYDSGFTTGYRLDGQTQRFFQSNFVQVYLETLANSSCYLQGVFDFTNDPASGKWSTSQQLYNSALTLRDVNQRRLKVRGKGRALQLKFTGEVGAPFDILGWNIWLTSNVTE